MNSRSERLLMWNRKSRVHLYISALTCLFVISASASAQSAPLAPSPIHDYHVDDYAIWLNLSPEQEHAVRRFREQYTAQWNEATQDLRAAYGPVMRAAQEEEWDPKDFNITELYSEAHRYADELRSLMSSHDEAFFVNMERLLTDEQHRHMPRVRFWRQRMRMPAAQIELQEAQVDLMQHVRIATDRQRRTLRADEPQYITLTRAEYEVLLAAIDEYEPQLVAGLEHRARVARTTWKSAYEAMDKGRLFRDAGISRQSDPDAWADIDRMRDQRGRQRIGPSRELERVNRWGLELFKQHLPDDKAVELQRIYLETAYPDVYPDPASAEKLYDAALAIETLTEDQRAGIVTLRQMFRQRHAAISQRMAEADRAQREALLRRALDFSAVRHEAFVRRNVAGREREQFNAQQYSAIALMLTLEQMEELPEWEFEAKPPPRPWFDSNHGFVENPRFRAPRTIIDHQQVFDALLQLSPAERRAMRERLEALLDRLDDAKRAATLEVLEMIDAIDD